MTRAPCELGTFSLFDASPTAPTLSPARMIALALLDELGAAGGLRAEGATLERYLDAIACPNDSAEMRRAMAGMSSCELLVLALWRAVFEALGLPLPPLLAGAYVDGMAGQWVLALAKKLGAWRPFTGGPLAVLPGDSVLVAAPEHAFTIAAASPSPNSDGIRLATLDGGRHDGIGEILWRTREIRDGFDHCDPIEDDAGHVVRAGLVRRVVGRVDLDALVGASKGGRS